MNQPRPASSHSIDGSLCSTLCEICDLTGWCSTHLAYMDGGRCQASRDLAATPPNTTDCYTIEETEIDGTIAYYAVATGAASSHYAEALLVNVHASVIESAIRGSADNFTGERRRCWNHNDVFYMVATPAAALDLIRTHRRDHGNLFPIIRDGALIVP